MMENLLAFIRSMKFARSKPTREGPDLNIRCGNPKTCLEDPERANAIKEFLDGNVNNNVFPIRHPDTEPPLFYITDRRSLNPDWVKWEMKNSGINEHDAYLVGALSMISTEFKGPMLNNVVILARNPEEPLRVTIKYNDPGKPGVPK